MAQIIDCANLKIIFAFRKRFRHICRKGKIAVFRAAYHFPIQKHLRITADRSEMQQNPLSMPCIRKNKASVIEQNIPRLRNFLNA